ncbi:MAG: TonB-dependent siderophore receptor [Acidobacteriaceae bacterium]|nr:TonB-dependent siderophore receptor [Acidobacteriaceae bacterium]
MDGAAVEVRCGSTVVNGITGKDGSVTLTLRPGTYTAMVQAAGFSAQSTNVTAPMTGIVAVQMTVASATDRVEVTGDSGFVPFSSNAGSKTNTRLIEVPQSISIVSQREMEARHVITMNEALRYTPGIQADEYGVEPRFDWLKIRGFDAQTFGVYRDGMRFNSLAGKLDPFELESVEVLKGPSSVLYGEVPPGGLINQVTKRPGQERSTSVEGQFGQYRRLQGSIDTTGSIDKAGVFRYRVLGLIRNSNTQTNFTPDDRRLIAPSISFHPSERTNFTVLADYQHDKTQWSQFLPANGTLYNTNPNGIIPINTFLGEPGSDYVRRNQGSIAYTGDHLFQNGWNLHSNYRYQYINFKGQTIFGAGFDGSSLTNVSRQLFATPNRNRFNTVDTRAMRRFTAGNWEQTALFGYDYQHINTRATSYFLFGLGDLNVYNPVYGQTAIPTGAPFLNNNTLLQQHGLYAQDQIKYRNHMIFTLGGRQDFAKNDITNFNSGSSNFSHLDTRFTGRVGVTYLTDFGIAPYVAYSTSFLPNAGTFVTNTTTGLSTNPAKPSDARQIEGGVKIQPRTSNSFITASIFQINQTNVIVADANFNSHQDGEARSRGLEIEGVASLGHGLNLHGGYTLTATNNLKDVTTANIGRWLPQTPKNQFSTLTDYTQRSGRFAGFGGNFGVRFVGTNAADASNSFFVPNYTLLDAGVRFDYRHILFGVNATNLADKRYVATCTATTTCYYGYARNVIGTAKYHF